MAAADVSLGRFHASQGSWSRQSNDRLLLGYRWALNFNLFYHVLLRAINTVDYNCSTISIETCLVYYMARNAFPMQNKSGVYYINDLII